MKFFKIIIILTLLFLFGCNNCSDGTKKDDCASVKPYFCSNGEIIENPIICGCPEGERIYDNKCIKEVICEDGTFEPECSEKLNKKCVDGELVFNAKECGCPDNYINRGNDCINTCVDGTAYGDCTPNKPYFCSDGKIIKNPNVCGCLKGFTNVNNICMSDCNDGTKYGKCSINKPYFCENSILIKNPGYCGCQEDYIFDNGICKYKYETEPKNVKLKYVLDGKKVYIDFIVYKGMNEYFSRLDRSIYFYEGESEPTTKDYILKNINNEIQKDYIYELVQEIKLITSDKNQQARIAISIVQNIPYDDYGADNDDLDNRIAYEVLFDNKGVCGEKSELLALLLRELDFGVAIFTYEVENHQALGIECSDKYDYLDSGYCFVESTTPSIITDSYGEYVGAGKLKSTPEINTISYGYVLDDVSQDYNDAIFYYNSLEEMNKLSEEMQQLEKKYGTHVDNSVYNYWMQIISKYDELERKQNIIIKKYGLEIDGDKK